MEYWIKNNSQQFSQPEENQQSVKILVKL